VLGCCVRFRLLCQVVVVSAGVVLGVRFLYCFVFFDEGSTKRGKKN
jgi:hypothetical protein